MRHEFTHDPYLWSMLKTRVLRMNVARKLTNANGWLRKAQNQIVTFTARQNPNEDASKIMSSNIYARRYVY